MKHLLLAATLLLTSATLLTAQSGPPVSASDPVNAHYLTDMALEADPGHRAALEARLTALQTLDATSNNSNERSWLRPAFARCSNG